MTTWNISTTSLTEEGPHILLGSDSDDTLRGAQGHDDYLYGGAGDDDYDYHLGDGHDTIDDQQGSNSLVVHHIDINQLKFLKEEKNLKIITPGQGTIIWKNFYEMPTTFSTFITHKDGVKTTWNVLTGSAIEETRPYILLGSDSDETLEGGKGNDILYGGGNDHFNGRLGDDILRGEAGSDTYNYHWGDGKDTIEDNQGSNTLAVHNIDINQLKFLKEEKNLKIITPDQAIITWINFYEKPEAFKKLITHRNGKTTTWENAASSVTVDSTNEFLMSPHHNGTINDSSRDGYFYGDDGNTQYRMVGGNDIIRDNGGSNTLELLESDIRQLNFLKEGQHLKIITGQGSVTWKNFYDNPGRLSKIITYLNDTPTTWTVATTAPEGSGPHILLGDGNDNTIDTRSLDNSTDYLYGFAGNDWLYAGGGNDYLYGGEGNDHLHGQDGDDTYVYHLGDGNDTIYDQKGSNTLELHNIEMSQLNFLKDGEHPQIITPDWGTITWKNFYNNPATLSKFIALEDGVKTTFTVSVLSSSTTGTEAHIKLAGNGYVYWFGRDNRHINKPGNNGVTITDNGGNDSVLLTEREKNQLHFSQKDDSLIITFDNSPNDKLTLKKQFIRDDKQWAIERLELDDGSYLPLADAIAAFPTDESVILQQHLELAWHTPLPVMSVGVRPMTN